MTFKTLANTIINKTITITASPVQVWRVFTDPTVTRLIGGEYVSSWKVGDSLGWKGEDGKMSTYGIILELEATQLLKHSLYDLKTKSRLTSTITYQFEDKGKYTILHAEEVLAFDMRDDQFEEALEGWDLALETVKEIAEKLK
ncbi:MAG: SRPBCC domain-containing protein [Saprospiraceae bacterium]